MEQGRNPQAARDHNRSLMLRLVRDRGPISRAELARASFLSKPAVTDIVDGLIRHRLVKETVKGDAAVGRKPMLLEINHEAMWAMGVDLSRDHVYRGESPLMMRTKVTLNGLPDVLPTSSAIPVYPCRG